jgi:hypothetical protein
MLLVGYFIGITDARAALSCSLEDRSEDPARPEPTTLAVCPNKLAYEDDICLLQFTSPGGAKGYYLLSYSEKSRFGPRYSVVGVGFISNLEIKNGKPVDNSTEGKISHQITWRRPILIDWKNAPGGPVLHQIRCQILKPLDAAPFSTLSGE